VFVSPERGSAQIVKVQLPLTRRVVDPDQVIEEYVKLKHSTFDT
jgi:hypothetical protein